MPFGTGDESVLLALGLRTIFGDAYKEHEKIYPKYMEMVKSVRAYDDDQKVTGLGTWGTKSEGADVDDDAPYMGDVTRYTNVTFGRGFTVTMEAQQDEQYGYIKKLPKSLSRGAVHRQEIDAANVLNRCTTAAYTGGDGQVLASVNHPLYGGGVQANRPTTMVDLSEAGLEQAYLDISAFTNDRGQKINAMAKKLVIAPALRSAAMKLLLSDKEVGGANNDINPYKGYISWENVIVVPWLTDVDQWNLFTDVEDGLKFQMRMEPDLVEDTLPKSRNRIFTGVGRWTVGWTNPFAVYISTGN